MEKFEDEQFNFYPEESEKFDWKKVRLEEWETPQAELEVEPEYKHLLEVCGELGLNL